MDVIHTLINVPASGLCATAHVHQAALNCTSLCEMGSGCCGVYTVYGNLIASVVRIAKWLPLDCSVLALAALNLAFTNTTLNKT